MLTTLKLHLSFLTISREKDAAINREIRFAEDRSAGKYLRRISF